MSTKYDREVEKSIQLTQRIRVKVVMTSSLYVLVSTIWMRGSCI